MLLEGESDRIPPNSHSLNITHRVPISEIRHLKKIAMFTLEASDDTQAKKFEEYITYFAGKYRVGYFCLKNLTVYVIIPKYARELFAEIREN